MTQPDHPGPDRAVSASQTSAGYFLLEILWMEIHHENWIHVVSAAGSWRRDPAPRSCWVYTATMCTSNSCKVYKSTSPPKQHSTYVLYYVSDLHAEMMPDAGSA